MYEYIQGTIDRLTPTEVVVDAAGVGYLLFISLQSYTQLEGKSSARLYTHFIVREDVQQLYGFASAEERNVFRLLIGVSGVGGNTARMVLSTFSSSEVCTIIGTGAAETLKTVKGLGLKTAQKIIVELRDKIGTISTLSTEASFGGASAHKETHQEAVSALTMLGFAKASSEKAVQQLLSEQPLLSVEELIRLALKKL